MVKGIALIKRRAGLSRDEFVEYYETNHAPLVLKHIPGIRRYVRNHITTLPGGPSGDEPDFDCISEFWFDDMEASSNGINVLASEAGDVIREDEEKFLDRSRIVFFHVDARESEIPPSE